MTGRVRRAVEADDAGCRLDGWFRRHYPALGHVLLEKLLRKGQIRVDGARVRSRTRLVAGQEIDVPALVAREAVPAPAPQPLTAAQVRFARGLVIHMDDDVIAVNKPPGLAVQGGTGTGRHLDALLDALRFEAPVRPRLVHRLDRETSGVVLLARHRAAAAALTRMFRERRVHKVYRALTAGCPAPPRGVVRLPLAPDATGAALSAVTHYEVLERLGPSLAWVAFMPVTGRTHQVRIHAAHLGAPVVGDGKYGGPRAHPGGGVARRLHLHAHAITLEHPSGGVLHCTAPLPKHMSLPEAGTSGPGGPGGPAAQAAWRDQGREFDARGSGG